MASAPIVAVSQCPRTVQCADAVAPLLTDLGWQVERFDCDAGGGARLELAVRDRRAAAVIEISLTDLAASVLQSRAGNDRLTAAAMFGLPQVVVLGGLDGAVLDSIDDVKRLTTKFAGRRYCRTSVPENDRLGRELAFRISASRGLAVIIAPLGGLSAHDAPGQRFRDPAADSALIRSIRNWIDPNVRIEETQAHLFDDECVRKIVAAFRQVTTR